jgi:hypothetical protein
VIRFRFREDEERYLNLLSEVYRALAHLPPAANRVALRNLGKMHDLLWLEGVRQGVAAAAISNLGQKTANGYNLEHLKAFQLHAHVYGSQDTPLRDIEVEWVTERLGANPDEADEPWLDPEPMRFAPDTEQAYTAAQKGYGAPGHDAEPVAPEAPDLFHQQWDGMEDEDVDFEATVDAILADGDDAQERPELLDRIRDALVNMASTGVKPRDWEDLILRLHMTLHVDAGFLDIQLGTPMGRTVLAQAGFFDLQPGPFGTNLSAVQKAAQEAPSATKDEP